MDGNGVRQQFPVMRHLLNLETLNTHAGTHDVHAPDPDRAAGFLPTEQSA